MAQHRQFMKNLDAVLDNNFAAPGFGVRQMADKMALSERQLQRKIRQLAGCSPSQYLQKFRLQKSVQYLREGVPVGEAAAAVGFRSHAYFTSRFRKRFGHLPSNCR
jgi:AraC-like DNA-binding protein